MAGFEFKHWWKQKFIWTVVNHLIRQMFPQVKQISPDSLHAWLSHPNQQKPLLLDTRTLPEYKVSHLRDAVWLNSESPDFAELPSDRQIPIVTYCSVGYRSAAVASRLQATGYENVSNLEGSIFQWANQSQPVYRCDTQVQQVHPYNWFWGWLLNPSLHADAA